MYDFLLAPDEQTIKKEAREFTRNEISSDFLRQMYKDEIAYPREFVEKLAAKNLRGIRFPEKWGGGGRGINPDESERCFTDEDMWEAHDSGKKN